MLVRKKANSIPQRELSWNKYSYLRETDRKTYYDCECGKRYLSYSALFLHFGRKHGRKISMNDQTGDFQLRNGENQTIYFYFIQKKGNFSQLRTNQVVNKKQTKGKNIFRPYFIRFIEEQNTEVQYLIKLSFLRKMLSKFSKYLMKCTNYQQKIIKEECLETVPLHFNDFMIKMQQEGCFESQQNYNSFCLIMIKLAQWMNKQGISSLIVQPNVE